MAVYIEALLSGGWCEESDDNKRCNYLRNFDN